LTLRRPSRDRGLPVFKRRSREAYVDANGYGKGISDSERIGLRGGGPHESEAEDATEAKGRNRKVSHADSKGQPDIQGRGQDAGCTGDGAVDGRGWWNIEPALGRVADGVPDRVDRIRCLGNAVVPQVAEVFAEAIKERLGL